MKRIIRSLLKRILWALAPWPLVAILAWLLGFFPAGHGFFEPVFILLMLLAIFGAAYWSFWALI
jgi:hypothetical protein